MNSRGLYLNYMKGGKVYEAGIMYGRVSESFHCIPWDESESTTEAEESMNLISTGGPGTTHGSIISFALSAELSRGSNNTYVENTHPGFQLAVLRDLNYIGVPQQAGSNDPCTFTVRH